MPVQPNLSRRPPAPALRTRRCNLRLINTTSGVNNISPSPYIQNHIYICRYIMKK